MENSCLMLAMSFHTSVDLSSIIEESDLTKYGMEKDPHITLLFDKRENKIDKDIILPNIKNILGDDEYRVFLEVLKDNYKFNVLDLFYLSIFDTGENDYLILRLKEDNEMFKILSKINKGLMDSLGVESDYDSYKPHLTIAELIPGTAQKYLDNKKLKLILSDSKVGFEDLVISYNSEYDKWWSITTFHTVERLFRSN